MGINLRRKTYCVSDLDIYLKKPLDKQLSGSKIYEQ